MYELRSAPNKKPIIVNSYEHAKAFDEVVKMVYGRDIIITPDIIPDEFDMVEYSLQTQLLARKTSINNQTRVFLNPDVIILGKDLANFESVDLPSILTPHLQSNSELVKQYKEGNTKALNSLVGKFLKEHKGHDPKEVTNVTKELIG